MASINRPTVSNHRTHEGAPARRINAVQELRRSVMSCMLWEREFYEDGQEISQRIADLVASIPDNGVIASIACEARTEQHLRHVPLLIARELARKPNSGVAQLLPEIIQRADELTEFAAIYWKDGRQPFSAQVKKGLARAFGKFNEYELAKYNRDGAVKLRDVLFLCHAKPKDDEQKDLWKRLVDGKLQIPDTWEVALSAGENKKEAWERLITERKLGGLATLRNLRNMQDAHVSSDLIEVAITRANYNRVLPFRFIAAARFVPRYERLLENAMFAGIETADFQGRVIILVDVSGSMKEALSEKSDMRRIDAASGVAMIAREMFGHIRVLTFHNSVEEIPERRGFALRDAIGKPRGGTYLGQAVQYVAGEYDLLIVITDEQSRDAVPNPTGSGYMINVASNRSGVGYGPWTHIDGFSEAVLKYIAESMQDNDR